MIMRETCGTWAGIRTHRAAGEVLCGACQFHALMSEAMPRVPSAPPRPPAAGFDPITPERAAHNRRVLLGAIADVDLESEAA